MYTMPTTSPIPLKSSRSWGNVTNASFPNTPTKLLQQSEFDLLYEGDTVYNITDGVMYKCTDPGTSGLGDAVWEPVSSGVDPTTAFQGTTGQYYSLGTNPLSSSSTGWTVLALVSPQSYASAKIVFGVENLLLRFDSDHWYFQCTGGTGFTNNNYYFSAPGIRKWHLVGLTYDYTIDRLSFLLNGTKQIHSTGVGNVNPGGVLTFGAAHDGSSPADTVAIHGVGYSTSVCTAAQFGTLFGSCIEQGKLTTDFPWTTAWRTGTEVPASPFTPFQGVGNLTRTGGACTFVENNRPVWL